MPNAAAVAPTTVPSPCIRACRLTPDRRLCTGCGRTLDEITRWIRMSDREKEAVLARLEVRPTASAGR